jgi:hypothetical protein
MDLQNIQKQLNTEFSKPSSKYIFWFDDKAEYEAEASDLVLDTYASGSVLKRICVWKCSD